MGEINAISHDSLARHLGIRFIAVGPDFVIGEMPVNENTRQPFGLLHGGASIVMAETLGSIASGLLVRHEEGTRVVGVEVSGSHVRGVREGMVTGVCRALKLGRTMHFWQINIYDPKWRLSCSSRLTVNVIRGPVYAGTE